MLTCPSQKFSPTEMAQGYNYFGAYGPVSIGYGYNFYIVILHTRLLAGRQVGREISFRTILLGDNYGWYGYPIYGDGAGAISRLSNLSGKDRLGLRRCHQSSVWRSWEGMMAVYIDGHAPGGTTQLIRLPSYRYHKCGVGLQLRSCWKSDVNRSYRNCIS